MNTYQCAERTGVKTIASVKEDLLALTDSGDGLTVDLSLLKRIDLSVAQILISANKEAKIKKIPFKLAGISPEIKKQLILCGVIQSGAK